MPGSDEYLFRRAMSTDNGVAHLTDIEHYAGPSISKRVTFSGKTAGYKITALTAMSTL